jgi:hypothetical protein
MILKLEIGFPKHRDQIMIDVDGGSAGALPGLTQQDLY